MVFFKEQFGRIMWYSLRQLKIIWYLEIVQEANLHSQKPSAQHTDTSCHCGVEMWTVEVPPDSTQFGEQQRADSPIIRAALLCLFQEIWGKEHLL